MIAQCRVCMHHCKLNEGQFGICRGRKNVNGSIIDSNYGKITSFALDPIEKKPLYHFYPGSNILSVGSYGCNFNCDFCQNYSISMAKDDIETVYVSPRELAQKAFKLKRNGNIGVAFTYNEPLIGYEYVVDTSKELKKLGMKSVVVTNGAVEEEIAAKILPHIDALNIDLKAFTQEFYDKIRGDINLVKAFIENASRQSHIELTTLIIPGENDSIEEMRNLSEWVASVDKTIPLHITRFFPRWKMEDREATKVDKIYELAELARESLLYVYEGNC